MGDDKDMLLLKNITLLCTSTTTYFVNIHNTYL